jgi:hypothetical protein
MSRSFERFAAACAVAVGAGGLAYAIAFLVILNTESKGAEIAGALFLMVGGLLSTAVLTAVYGRVRDTDPGFALWGLVLGVAGSLGSAIHGGFDLGRLVDDIDASLPPVPHPVDPRGLMTFAVTAIAVSTFAWLIVRGDRLPRALGYMGFAVGALFLVLYLGRLIIVDPTSPVLLGAAVLSGFVVNPAWFIWLGMALRQEPPPGTQGGR